MEDFTEELKMIEDRDNIYQVALDLKIPERKVVDFSASINPLGVSKKVKAEMRRYLKVLPNYPDPDCRRLRWHLSRQLNVPDKNIVCGNGSTEVIHLIIKALKPEKLLIPAPSLPDYKRAVMKNSSSCSSSSTTVNFFMLKEEDDFKVNMHEYIDAMNGCDMSFLCNPNDPTGYLIERNQLLQIANEAKKNRCFLVVNEAFIDFVPEDSVATEVIHNPFLIVLRTMSTFHALSGIRLGFGIFHEEMMKNVLEKKEPWAVNTLAQRAGVVAIRDRIYKKQTFELMKREKRFVEEALKKYEISFYPSKVNFYLLKSDHAPLIYKGLRERGIVVKDCSDIKGLDERFLRIAVKTHRENTLLFKNISELL